MNRHATRTRVRTLALLVVLTCAVALPSAQAPAKKPLSVDDYTKWRSVTGQEISGDGKWATYVLQLTNVPTPETKPVLHLLNVETGEDVAVPDATGGVFSPDSRWIAYEVDPGRERRGRSGRGAASAAGESPSTEPAVPPGAQTPATPAAQPGRGASAGPIPPRRVDVRNLANGTVQSWEEIQAFLFSPASTHLVMKRRPAPASGGRGAAAPASGGSAPAGAPQANASGAPAETPAGPRGTDVILLDLRTGRHQLLGSVGDIAFNKAGDLLAYAVDAAVKDANGVFVFDARRGRITPLDTAARLYGRVAWSEDGTALAVLKGAEVEKKRERDNVLLAFRNLPSAIGDEDVPLEPVVLDPAKAPGFPKGWVISDRAALAWSDDDKRVFFGIKEQVPAPDTAARKTTDEASDVDVWNTADERIQSVQMIRAEQDRNFTFRQAFDVPAGRFVKLADETMRDLEVAQDGRWAVGRDTRGYVHDHKRPAADIYRVDTTTGERTLMVKGQIVNTSTGSHTFGISPDGHYFLYWKDNKYQVYDFDGGPSRTLGGVPPASSGTGGSKAAAVSFVDMEFDHPGPRPSYGVAGYTSDGKTVIVQQRYDLWALPLDGSAPRNLTNGAGTSNEIRFRYVRTEPNDPPTTLPAAPAQPGGAPGGPPPGFVPGGRGGSQREKSIDLSKPIVLSAYGEWTKKAGFYELANGQLKQLVYEDAAFSTPVKAAKAETFLFTRQTFTEFPDLRISGGGFTDSRKVTDANPQQAEFLWGHRLLFDFKDKDGHRLQAVLAIPDDYKPGEKRPMLVSFYEKNSQNLHRYNAPSYLTGMGASPMQAVSNGYVTLLPDVQFHTGASHSDMLDAVEAATRKAIEMGYVDPKRIGINGHSYGGEGAAFIGTRSRLFAAVGVGAGVTDLYYDFNQNWGWSYQVTGGSGANGSDYYLYSQGREGMSPWDKPDMYMFESALTHVPEATAPFLIMHGTADPTVSFTNGLAFYNALRYNNKKAVLLAYPGEGHGLRGMANRKDLTIRYFEFFDHYLKGAPAPTWITDGVPFLRKETRSSGGDK